MPANRRPAATDFTIPVEEVGTFTFAARTMGDELKIQVEYARIIDGVTPTDWLAAVAGWLSTLRVLTVRAPEGWDLDSLDPLDTKTYANLQRVCAALSAKEGSFRQGDAKRGQGDGAGAVQDA